MGTVASAFGRVISTLRTNPSQRPPFHWMWLAFQL
jgi:hypothetical protein